MTVLLTELLNRLKKEAEFDLIDMLGLTSEDIVNRFRDEIEERYEDLSRGYEEDDIIDGSFSAFDPDEAQEDF